MVCHWLGIKHLLSTQTNDDHYHYLWCNVWLLGFSGLISELYHDNSSIGLIFGLVPTGRQDIT